MPAQPDFPALGRRVMLALGGGALAAAALPGGAVPFASRQSDLARAAEAGSKPFTPARNHSAHPLGGCRMGATATHGVVDDRGRVFDASPGVAGTVHPGLYMVDGAIVPTALGNNPLLTITALAERVAELILRDPAHAGPFSTGDGPGPPAIRQSP